jgi:hypothetical protein
MFAIVRASYMTCSTWNIIILRVVVEVCSKQEAPDELECAPIVAMTAPLQYCLTCEQRHRTRKVDADGQASCRGAHGGSGAKHLHRGKVMEVRNSGEIRKRQMLGSACDKVETSNAKRAFPRASFLPEPELAQAMPIAVGACDFDTNVKLGAVLLKVQRIITLMPNLSFATKHQLIATAARHWEKVVLGSSQLGPRPHPGRVSMEKIAFADLEKMTPVALISLAADFDGASEVDDKVVLASQFHPMDQKSFHVTKSALVNLFMWS